MIKENRDMFASVLYTDKYRKKSHSPYNEMGECFTTDLIDGNSDYWIYRHDDLFAITISDFFQQADMQKTFEQTEYISVFYYDSIKMIPFGGMPPMEAGRVSVHISEGEPYTAKYCGGIPVRGVAINIMPRYYEAVLSDKLPGGFTRLKQAFAALSRRDDAPELLLILRQLQNSRATGDIARLYYESKVAEVVAVTLAYAEENRRYGALPDTNDRRQLQKVEGYIASRFHTNITLAELACIACMSVSKLKYSFKALYGCTVSDYIAAVRLEQAKKLLEDRTLSISAVAPKVGYQNTGSFTRRFKEQTGMLPKEYRKSAGGL